MEAPPPPSAIGSIPHMLHTPQVIAEIDDDDKNALDLDQPSDFASLLHAIGPNRTRNFIVDFSDETAQAKVNLSASCVASLLEDDRSQFTSTRWINIWMPHEQKPLLEVVARRYDFSPRLLALMCSNPPRDDVRRQAQMSTSSRRSWKSSSIMRTGPPPFDTDKTVDELSAHSSLLNSASDGRGNLYCIVGDLWHYSSVDFGRNYVCIGYNSLYGTERDDLEPGDGPLPHCRRVWTWLIICEDSTVISINEDPFPYEHDDCDRYQRQVLHESRRNLLNVLRSLSKADGIQVLRSNPLTVLPLRTRLGDTPEETAHRESDAPGLLLYYLFENWQNSYTLVTRRESRYGVELDQIRADMFKQPKLCHIDRLDQIGKELGVLKRHYQSYERLIDRLLEPQTASAASLQNSHVLSESSQASLATVRPFVTEKDSLLGVLLSSATRMRFRRLRDMIDLYALSEVDEYVKQKESLVTMNFNLIALKESSDMDRLTRITLLLTKATILFLPVSFMSGYFSINLVNVEYTVAEYWVSFAVVFLCSWLALFVFGVFSGTLQTIAFLRPLREVWQWVRSLFASGTSQGGSRWEA